MHLCIGNPLEKLKCLCSLAFIVLIREILWIAARLDSHLEKADMVELREESPLTSDRCCCCSLLDYVVQVRLISASHCRYLHDG